MGSVTMMGWPQHNGPDIKQTQVPGRLWEYDTDYSSYSLPGEQGRRRKKDTILQSDS